MGTGKAIKSQHNIYGDTLLLSCILQRNKQQQIERHKFFTFWTREKHVPQISKWFHVLFKNSVKYNFSSYFFCEQKPIEDF